MSCRPNADTDCADPACTGSAPRSSPRCRRSRLRTGCDQPRPGIPRRRRAASDHRRRGATAMRGGRNQYPPGWGVPELRAAIAEHQRRFYGLELDPDTEVLVTTGATEAIAAALLALVDPGDEVVALEPYYDSYVACIAMAGGRRVPVTLARAGLPARPRRAARGGDPADQAAADQHARTTRPARCSPTTSSRRSRDVAVEHDLIVITDEVYEHLTFDGVAPPPAGDLRRDARAHLDDLQRRQDVLVHRLEGRLGDRPGRRWCAPTMTAKQFLTYTSGAPFQPAIAAALALRRRLLPRLRARRSQAKRDRLCGGLREIGFERLRPAGHVLRRPPTSGRSGTTTAIDFCLRAARALRRRRDPARGVLRRQGGRAGRWCVGRSASRTHVHRRRDRTARLRLRSLSASRSRAAPRYQSFDGSRSRTQRRRDDAPDGRP